jgi:hypothetical protein
MQKVRSIREHLDSLMGFGGVHIAHHFGFVYCVELCCVFLCFVLVCLRLRVILHQFWVKKLFPSKFNLEYGGILTKLFMHVSSRNMFPTTKVLSVIEERKHLRHLRYFVTVNQIVMATVVDLTLNIIYTHTHTHTHYI